MSINIKREKNCEEYTIIVGYRPNEDEKKEDKGRLFKDLQEVDKCNDKIIIVGDLNGRVGKNGATVKNKNGEGVIEFCLKNELKIENTYFNKKEMHKITRQVDKGNKNSIINYFLINKEAWRNASDVKVRRGVKIGSSHLLLVMRYKQEGTIELEEKRKSGK